MNLAKLFNFRKRIEINHPIHCSVINPTIKFPPWYLETLSLYKKKKSAYTVVFIYLKLSALLTCFHTICCFNKQDNSTTHNTYLRKAQVILQDFSYQWLRSLIFFQWKGFNNAVQFNTDLVRLLFQ